MAVLADLIGKRVDVHTKPTRPAGDPSGTGAGSFSGTVIGVDGGMISFADGEWWAIDSFKLITTTEEAR